MALMTAAYSPELWKAVIASCPITDLAAWHGQNKNYAPHIEACCGGPPDSPGRIEEYKKRSPVYYTEAISDARVYILHGKNDASVPFIHSLNLFNRICGDIPAQKLTWRYSRRTRAETGQSLQNNKRSFSRRQQPFKNIRLADFYYCADTSARSIYRMHKQILSITFRILRHPEGTFGEKIKKFRLERGLRQKDIAIVLGVNEMTIANQELGRRKPAQHNAN